VEIELIDVITVSPKLMEPVPVPIRRALTGREETDPWRDVKFWRMREEIEALKLVSV
jgi:hypothetical protein